MNDAVTEAWGAYTAALVRNASEGEVARLHGEFMAAAQADTSKRNAEKRAEALAALQALQEHAEGDAATWQLQGIQDFANTIRKALS